jgi:cathepsin A (carboxypeptidase C)
MKFTSTLAILLACEFATSFASSDEQHSNNALRGSSSTPIPPKKGTTLLSFHSSAIASSSCLSYHDENSCNASSDENGIKCVWCKCAAVPSECLNLEQSKNVPPGVFDCASSSTESDNNNYTEERIQSDMNAENQNKNAQFLSNSEIVVGSTKYALQDDTVDGSLCDSSSKSLAGYMDVSGSQYDSQGEDKHLFYWFFEKRSSQDSTTSEHDSSSSSSQQIPMIVWLTGGPGCSSTLALLTENGPCSVAEDGKSTNLNPYSWTEAAHVLWLDQPAGVGYSYGEMTDTNEEMISEDAYYFLQGFFKTHPEYSQNPLFIVGESYGGHYAPAIAHKIWLKNKKSSGGEGLIHLILGGLAVGNGLTNPIEQYKWYPEMAYNNSHGIKTVSESTYDAMTSAVDKCVELIQACNNGDSFVNSFACQTAFVICNASETAPYQMSGLNPYDIRKECGDHPLCYDFSNIETFLNLDSTKEALHISKKSHEWHTCNMGINLKFHVDWMKDFSPYVKDLLNDEIPVLIYAGDVDFICNYLGNKAWTLGLDWKHGDEFRSVDEHEWGSSDDGTSAAGLVRTAKGFTFMQVYDAGHMVPTDQPSVALAMIKNFIEGGTF